MRSAVCLGTFVTNQITWRRIIRNCSCMFHCSFGVFRKDSLVSTTSPSYLSLILGELQSSAALPDSTANEIWRDIERMELGHARQKIEVNPL